MNSHFLPTLVMLLNLGCASFVKVQRTRSGLTNHGSRAITQLISPLGETTIILKLVTQEYDGIFLPHQTVLRKIQVQVQVMLSFATDYVVHVSTPRIRYSLLNIKLTLSVAFPGVLQSPVSEWCVGPAFLEAFRQ